MEVDDSVEDVLFMLADHPSAERTEVVPEVDLSGRLDAGQDPSHALTLVARGETVSAPSAGLPHARGRRHYHEIVPIEVSTPVYEGPFDLLLHLIMREEVDIHEVSLSTIVDAYLAELGRMRELDLEIATEFLLIAATLVEIKSRRLLPGRDAVEIDDELALWEERDLLLARLLECKTFKDVAQILARFVDDADLVYPRTTGPDERFAGVVPDPLEGLTLAKLQRGFVAAITPKSGLSLEMSHVSPVRFAVPEAVDKLMQDLPLRREVTFRDLTGSLVERLEIIVHFLAVLELYKQGWIEIDQHDRFGDITVTWTGVGPDAGSNVEIDVYEG